MRPDKVTLADLFGQQRRYVVPLFQRGYVWTREGQWVPLWRDVLAQGRRLVEADEGRTTEIRRHFLGAVVLDAGVSGVRHVTDHPVIDGQQRLTTLQLLLMTFRDVVAPAIDSDLTRELTRLTVNEGQWPNPDEQFKVRPTVAGPEDWLDGAEPPLSAIEEMAARYLQEVRAVRSTGPYQLGGWSMGGLIAFEMARRLEAERERVTPLLLFDCPALPILFRDSVPDWPLGAYLQELADASGRSVPMTEEERVALAQLAHRVATYTANLKAVIAYRPAGTVAAGVLSFRGAQSSFPEEWTRWSRGEVVKVDVAGDHYTMLGGVGEPLQQLLGRMAQ